VTARDIPGQNREAADAAPPANRAERRGRGRKPPAAHGHGKVQGPKFTGPAPRTYQNRKAG
jgi:hypothetical protein